MMPQFFHMYEVFRGWRRKTGVVTLVMACLFMAAWLRTWVSSDHIQIPVTEKSTLTIASSNRVLGFVCGIDDNPTEDVFEFLSFPATERTEAVMGVGHINSPLVLGAGYELKWKIACAGIIVGQSDHLSDFGWQFSFAVVPYWVIVMALIAISAFLIWYQPRLSMDRTTPQTSEKPVLKNGDFFKVMRKRFGIVTLALSCMFAAGWLTSFWRDACLMELHYKTGEHDRDDLVFSVPGQIPWAQTRNIDASWPYNTAVSLSTGERPKYASMVFELPLDFRWEFVGFRYADGLDEEGRNTCFLFFIPYWSIILPLALLSTWLLRAERRPITPLKPAKNQA